MSAWEAITRIAEVLGVATVVVVLWTIADEGETAARLIRAWRRK